MKTFYPVVLALFFWVNAAAQSTQPKPSSLKPYEEGRLSAKLNTLSWFIDPETPTLQPGIEYRFNKRLSGELTFGIPTRIHGNIRQTDSTYNRYYKLKAELKFFPGDKRSFYVAPEITYVSKERSKYDGTFVGKDSESYGYDYAELDKKIVAFAIKTGWIVPFKKNNRWFMDLFVGAGPRFIHMNAKTVNRRPEHATWMFWTSDREGSTTAFHFTAGLKIGYIIF